MRRSDPHGREAGGQGRPAALAPSDTPPGPRRQPLGQLLRRDWLVFGCALDPGRWPTSPTIGRRGKRRFARWPEARRRLHTQHIGQIQPGEGRSEGGLDAIAGIAQHHALRNALRQGRPDSPQGDLRLGLKADLLRHAGPGPPLGVARPGLGQVEPIGDRQAGMVVGHRQTHRHLTVVLLAELAAVLPRHPNRVLALLRETGVVDDPVLHRPVPPERRQDLLSHGAQQRRIAPLGLGHHVMQRLMPRPHSCWLDPRRHRLDALAGAG